MIAGATERSKSSSRLTLGTQSAAHWWPTTFTLLWSGGQGNLEAQLDLVFAHDDLFEDGANERLALSEGHGFESLFDLVGELVDPASELRPGHVPLVTVVVAAFEFGDAIGEGAPAGVEVAEADRPGLVGVDEPAILGS